MQKLIYLSFCIPMAMAAVPAFAFGIKCSSQASATDSRQVEVRILADYSIVYSGPSYASLEALLKDAKVSTISDSDGQPLFYFARDLGKRGRPAKFVLSIAQNENDKGAHQGYLQYGDGMSGIETLLTCQAN